MSKTVVTLDLPPLKTQVEIAIGEGLLKSDLAKICRSRSCQIAIIADRRSLPPTANWSKK